MRRVAEEIRVQSQNSSFPCGSDKGDFEYSQRNIRIQQGLNRQKNRQGGLYYTLIATWKQNILRFSSNLSTFLMQSLLRFYYHLAMQSIDPTASSILITWPLSMPAFNFQYVFSLIAKVTEINLIRNMDNKIIFIINFLQVSL